MTGFGAAEGMVGGSKVSVELRSVNHRFFNPSIKLPGVLAKWENLGLQHQDRRWKPAYPAFQAVMANGVG